MGGTEGRDSATTEHRLDDRPGEVLLWLTTASGDTEWHFAVDPGNRQWSLYRSGDGADDLFYWVEPRPLPVQRSERSRRLP